MKVDFTVLGRQYAKYQAEYEEAALRALRSGWYILGNELKEFEAQFAAFHGIRHCMGLNSGLDALRLALAALGIGSGDEVIVQANTYIATALAITENGATPVFVDADDYFGVDAEKIEAKVTPRTKAIMPVHLYGQPCDMDAVMAVAKRHGLYVVEDCAQAHGSTFGGRKVGTFGEVGCFSFYPTKPVGAFGDAGAIITDNDEVAKRVAMLRNYGSRVKYHHDIIGLNSRMDELQAAILKVNLKYMCDGGAERQSIAQRYLDGIRYPRIRLPETRRGATHVYHVFAVLCEERDGLQAYLEDKGVHTQIHYPIPCHLAGCYKSLGYNKEDFPISEAYAEEELSLPIYVGMPEEEVGFVIDTINSFC